MYITRPADIERAADFIARANAPQLPLFRAVADRRIALVAVGRPDNAWPAAIIARATRRGRPAVVLVGDDPAAGFPDALGPLRWKAAARLGRWCNWVMIHAAGGEHGHYSAAVQAAELVGRVALIETGTQHAAAWSGFLGCRHTLLIAPRDGLPHPVRPAVVQ